MASARAFGILNNQNHVSGNQPLGKSVHSSKNGENRASSGFALKDLTNKNQRILVRQDGSKGPINAAHGGKPLAGKTKTIMQKISTGNKKPVSKKPQHQGYEEFAPQNAEYSWGQVSCLRDDLLDQMLDFPDVSRKAKRNMPKPASSDLLDLPDLDAPWDCFEPAEYRHTLKPLQLPADDFPLVDMQNLEFIF